MDYEALAKQYGGVVTQPPVDFEALAKQYGGVVASTPLPQSGIPGPRQQPGLLTQVGRGAASLADVTIGGVIPAVVQQVGYPLARIGRSEQEAKAAMQRLVGAVDQPFGRAFGVSQTPEYQGEAGRQIVDFIGQNIQKGARWLSEKTGLPVSDVENMMGSAAIAAPKVVAPVAKKATAAAAPAVQTLMAVGKEIPSVVTQLGQEVKAGVTLPFERQIQARRERLSLEDYARGPQIDAIKDAQRLELFLNPMDIQSTVGTRAMALAGGVEGAQNIAAKNIPRVQQVGRNEMGLPPTAQLNGRAAFDTARAKVAGPYEEVRKLPVQQADQFVIDGLERLRPNQALIGKDAVAAAANALIDEALAKTQGGLNGAQLLDNVSSLRTDAQLTHKNLSATPAQIDLANTQFAIASQLESMMDSSISNPRLLGEWRDSRQKMARIYGYEGATDFNTGLIDIKKLADITAKDNALTGDIAALGRIAGNFPSAFSTTIEAPTFRQQVISRGGPAGTAGAVTAAMLDADWRMGLAAGVGGALAGYFGGKFAANRLASPGYQAGLTVRDRRIPVAEPPLGPTIPQNRMLAPYQPEVVGPGGAGEASKLRVVSYDENGVPIYMASPPQPGFTMPPQPEFGNRPTTFVAQRGLPNEVPQQIYEAQRRAELAQGFREAAERKPASGEVILDFDPVTGRFRTESQGLPGATPATFQDFGASLKTAADKATAGRMFDMTAAEKVAWNKTKVDLAEVAPGFKALNDRAVAAKMLDREWIQDTLQKAKQKEAAFVELEARANSPEMMGKRAESAKNAEMLRQAAEAKDRVMSAIEILEERLRMSRPTTSGKQQGPKTRAAKRNALAPDNQNNLAP